MSFWHLILGIYGGGEQSIPFNGETPITFSHLGFYKNDRIPLQKIEKIELSLLRLKQEKSTHLK